MGSEQRSGVPSRWLPGCSAAVVVLFSSAPGAAQQTDDPPPHTAEGDASDKDDRAIVVTAPRGSAVTDVPPIAEFDENAVAAMGAATMDDVVRTIRGVAQAADGSPPIFLLNAQRVSSYQEIGSLPPEALEKIEVLPEPAALRFGFPPTRRVVNFITKRRFRQIEVKASAGTLTRGGSSTLKANAGITRLHDDARMTLALEYRRTDPVFQSDRNILPDPDIPFDELGNVTGTSGGEIDPALSAIAGQPVLIAPVPEAAADQDDLAAFAAGANQPRLFDIGPYRTMTARNEGFKAEAVLADRIGETMAGSLTLSAEQIRDSTLGGPATVRLTVPAASPYSPFTVPVTLNRYLTEVDPLAQQQTTTKLHAGVTLRGAVAGWQWDFTGVLDQQQLDGRSERQVDTAAANAAIAAGTNPFAPLDPTLLAARQSDRGRQRTRTAGGKTVATNTPVWLPAGAVTVTATAEAEAQGSDSVVRGLNPSEVNLSRTSIEGGLALDVPLTSRNEGVLPFLGDLSLNGSFNARNVSGFGSLSDWTYGLAWGPIEGVQLLATVKHSGTAPEMAQLSTPVVRVPNATIYDTTNGRTEVVTLIQGGNPDLAATRRDSRSLTLNVKPFAEREIRLSVTYETAQIHDQTGTVYAITPQTDAILPDMFVRDASGRLISVSYQPTSFAFERQRTLTMTLSANGRLGKPPPPPPPGSSGVQQGPSFYAGIGPTFKLLDRLQLRRGAPEFDLLGGDTVTGWGNARAQGYVYGGLNYHGFGTTFDGWYSGPSDVHGPTPADDLHFSSILRLNFAAYMPVHRVLRHVAWTKGMQLRLEVSNLTDNRQHVRDARGATPNRYQSDYLDATGRSVTLVLRKFL